MILHQIKLTIYYTELYSNKHGYNREKQFFSMHLTLLHEIGNYFWVRKRRKGNWSFFFLFNPITFWHSVCTASCFWPNINTKYGQFKWFREKTWTNTRTDVTNTHNAWSAIIPGGYCSIKSKPWTNTKNCTKTCVNLLWSLSFWSRYLPVFWSISLHQFS